MKNKIGAFYRNSVTGYYLIRPIFLIYELFLKAIPDEMHIKFKFKRHMGYSINLKNPQTFNEKINWLKLYDRTPLHTTAADKFKVREYIANKIGKVYLIPLLYNTKNAKNIVPENLPDFPIIIKTNHNSSGGIIVKNKNDINWKRAQFDLKKNFRENYFYSSREWQYKYIEPRIVVEKLLTDKNGAIPYDYKLHCFNGKLVFTQVDLDRQTNHTRNLYDVDWNVIPCKWTYDNGKQIEKPITYEKMKNLAEIIAEDFIYVRVDFYVIEKNLFFGELTFHSESGLGQFLPKSYDAYFGNLLKLPVQEFSSSI